MQAREGKLKAVFKLYVALIKGDEKNENLYSID